MRIFSACAVLAIAGAWPSGAIAQVVAQPIEEMSDKADVTRDPNEKDGNKDLLIVPIPQSSPKLGSGLTLVGALFYNPMKEPSPWITGVGIMRTSNGSRAFGAMHRMSLGGDRFRLSAFAGRAQINVNFYGIGPAAGDRDLAIKLEEKGYAFAVLAQYRLAPHFYVGGRVVHLDLDTSIHNPEPRFPDAELPAIQFESKLSSLGPVITYDRRNNSINPTDGEYIIASLLFSAPGLGSDFSHEKLTVAANIYRPIGRNTVVAARASLCGVSNGAPFYDLCLYGSSNDLRGYEAGKYRDRASWAAQVELRQRLFGRFGAVLFGGIGGSSPSLDRLFDGVFLPAAGLGLRYGPIKTTPVNVRVDFAVGKHSRALYISVGEAF